MRQILIVTLLICMQQSVNAVAVIRKPLVKADKIPQSKIDGLPAPIRGDKLPAQPRQAPRPKNVVDGKVVDKGDLSPDSDSGDEDPVDNSGKTDGLQDPGRGDKLPA